MLRDIVTYGGQRILTIYHENKELDVQGRYWKVREKIGRYWLVFEESSGHSADEFPTENSLIEHELLPYRHPLSPCDNCEICVIMKRRRYEEKPSHIFLPDLSGFRVSPEQWDNLCKFVKHYTGIDLSEAPMACGDIFCFHYVQLRYHETKHGTVKVDSIGFDRIDIHFRRGDSICEFQTRVLNPDKRCEIEFVPKEDWDVFDIYAYEDNSLFFFAKDVCFIHSIGLIMSIGNERSVYMKKHSYEAKFSNYGNRETTRIGQEKTNLRLSQNHIEKQLLETKPHQQVSSYLIQRGDINTAFRLVNNLLNRSWDEVWLLDPYLTDEKGKSTLIDWMRLICGSPTKAVRAIYYHKKDGNNSLALSDIKNILSNDWALSEMLRCKETPLQIIGLSEYVHDRFLLCREGENYFGISFGTSLNSLDSNYFCIHSLTPRFAAECWKTFTDIIERHTVEIEEIGNE